MHFFESYLHFVQSHEAIALFVFVLGVVIEGEFALIIAGIFAALHGWHFYNALLFGFLGAAIKLFLGYSIGRGLAIKYPQSKFFKYVHGKIHHYLPLFSEKPFWSIFISKFIYGVNHVTLIFSGYSKIHFKTYLKAETLSSILWVPLFVCLGYFFSHTALQISNDIRKFTFVIFAFILGFILLERIIVFFYELAEEK